MVALFCKRIFAHLRGSRNSCQVLFLRCFVTEIKSDDLKALTKCPQSGILDQAKLLSGLHQAEQFKHAMLEFKARDKYMRGHMQFISLALSRMEEFELQTNLMTYNRILDLFPKGRYNNKTLLDAVWPKPHPQIDLALKVLTKMEEWGVRPDNVTYTILVEIFGRDSPPVDKCKRIAYWFDRFESSDPYEIKGSLPECMEELGILVLSRIAPDYTEMNVHKVDDSSTAVSGSCIVSALLQPLHLYQHSVLGEVAYGADRGMLHVGGPHRVWIKRTQQHYYTLTQAAGSITGDNDALLAVCFCCPESLDVVQTWVKELQKTYALLKVTPILFDVNIPVDLQPVRSNSL